MPRLRIAPSPRTFFEAGGPRGALPHAAIGVLPMGTLNHFAKDVGIPRHLEAAVHNIFTGQVTNVDVG